MQIDKDIVESHHHLLKMRKSPVREASCELEADAHALSLLNRNQDKNQAQAEKKRRHLAPELAVPSLDMLWEEEKLRHRKVKNYQTPSSSEAISKADAHVTMRNVTIGNGFITRPKLLRGNKKGTVLHR